MESNHGDGPVGHKKKVEKGQKHNSANLTT